MFKRAIATTIAACLSTAAIAGDVSVNDAYARSSSPAAKVGAAFMEITNGTDHEIRLTGVTSPAAAMVELHSHIAGDGGVMKMTRTEDGLTIPAGETAMLKRGGDHVMMMGLTAPLTQGDTIPLTLEFDGSDDLTIDVPVDLER